MRLARLCGGLVFAGLLAGCASEPRTPPAPPTLAVIEQKVLTTGPDGPANPGDEGVPFTRVSIPSGPRRLAGTYVAAPAACRNAPMLLIYHGVRETVSDWAKAQAWLYGRCVSSLVFDYTGSGNSPRPARFQAINDDGVAAFTFARRLQPGARLYVFAHSMGNAVMLQALPRFASRPAGVVVASPFSSMHDFARRAGEPFASLVAPLPDWWNNVEAVRSVRAPLLVVHSRADRTNPVEDGEKVFAAAPQPKRLQLLDGFGHNALYQNPDDAWWHPVLDFIGAPPAP